jgi:cell division protein FtsA
LPELLDVADNVLQCQARFGLPVGIRHWPEGMDRPEWSVAAGLAMYSAKLRSQEQRAKRGILGKIL